MAANSSQLWVRGHSTTGAIEMWALGSGVVDCPARELIQLPVIERHRSLPKGDCARAEGRGA